jgi:hypothetical protein
VAGGAQLGPELAHRFTAQVDGPVTARLDGMTTDHDLFVLAGTCDPLACVAGATAPGTEPDAVTFDAVAGESYCLVVEAAGGAGPYSLDFPTGGGCLEDCDNGVDDDLDGAVDCLDDTCDRDLPCTAVFGDGFESGDVSRWSAATP